MQQPCGDALIAFMEWGAWTNNPWSPENRGAWTGAVGKATGTSLPGRASARSG
jgi:hypothetical protein